MTIFICIVPINITKLWWH